MGHPSHPFAQIIPVGAKGMKKRIGRKRLYQKKLWDAAKFYCKEAQKSHKAKAYFCALVARASELEALLRIFDLVETRKPKDRCRDLYGLINRAFVRHWVPHDALRWWKSRQDTTLKPYLHEIREARNGVHAHLFQKNLFTRRTSANVTYLVHSVYSAIEIKNARNLMWGLYASGEISPAEYWTWKKKAGKID
jgi:hypothetical protein